MTFEEAVRLGAEGEHIVARWLMGRGVTILPLYQFEGHDRAPRLFRGDTSLTAPDLTCFGRTAFFAEVKRKSRWTRSGSRIETGCNLRLWRHYVQVAETTKAPVFLFFLHDSGDRPGLYYQSTAILAPALRAWDGLHDRTRKKVSPPMALFPVGALIFVPLSDVI